MRKLSFCTLALCLGFASTTHASSFTRLVIKGNTASGGISTADDPCLSGSLSVEASDSVVKDGTTTTQTKELYVAFFGSDSCKSVFYYGFAVVPLTVNVANQATVTLPFDFMIDETPFDAEVPSAQRRVKGSATITATGDFQKSRQVDITQNEMSRQVVRTKGSTRDATIVVNAKLAGNQLSFNADSGYAELGTTKNGTIEITRY
jgi:hypothetical protein